MDLELDKVEVLFNDSKMNKLMRKAIKKTDREIKKRKEEYDPNELFMYFYLIEIEKFAKKCAKRSLKLPKIFK